MWTFPVMWTDKVHVSNAIVVEGRSHGIEFDESMAKITFDFEIYDLDSY